MVDGYSRFGENRLWLSNQTPFGFICFYPTELLSLTTVYDTNMTDIKPFDPTIPKDDVDRLFRKLADTRLPEIPVVPDAGDDYGMLESTRLVI
jgi:hypothetical protein